MLPPEPEVLDARQGFPDAQQDLAGPPLETVAGFHSCGWYGTTLNDERGCFAVVGDEGPLAELIGDRLLLRYGLRSIYVYCFASAPDLEQDIVITRRAFAALDLLARESIDVLIEVIAG